MLKRQRTSTPPPTSQSVPELSNGDLDTFNHPTKRRRIVSPILDGRERGMEIDADNDGLDDEPNSAVAASTDILSHEQKPGHYTFINKLLGSLHWEHRLRRQAPSSESSTRTPGSTSPAPRHLQAPPKNAHLGTPQRPQETRAAGSKDENTIYKQFNEFLGSLARMRKRDRNPDQA